MGLTVACARCHDHKYDPISAADYYALYGVFASSKEKAARRCPASARRRRPARGPRSLPPRQSRQPRPKGRAAFPLLPGGRGKAARRSSTAAAAAKWPMRSPSRDNPLTARVWVNRVWAHLFGTGLVATPSDFGIRGTPPDASRIARLARLRVYGRRLVDQAAHPPHRAFEHLSPGERRRVLSASRSIPRTSCCGAPIAADSIWNRFAIACSSPPAGSTKRWAGHPCQLTDRTVLHAAHRLRLHRTPKPARVLPHVRLRQPEHAHARTPAHHRPATSAVPHEQPVRDRASHAPSEALRQRPNASPGPGEGPGEAFRTQVQCARQRCRQSPPHVASTTSSATPSAAHQPTMNSHESPRIHRREQRLHDRPHSLGTTSPSSTHEQRVAHSSTDSGSRVFNNLTKANCVHNTIDGRTDDKALDTRPLRARYVAPGVEVANDETRLRNSNDCVAHSSLSRVVDGSVAASLRLYCRWSARSRGG